MLAVLPNGEAFKPDGVDAVVIQPGIGLPNDMVERFEVWLVLKGAEPRCVAAGLPRDEAQVIAVRCAGAINRALKERDGQNE
jgi:hypothetical protein